MFNLMKLNKVLEQYKEDFISKLWENERFKWEAVKCFQDNWNVGSDDFSEMLEHSLNKASDLLTSYNNFPKGMIENFSKAAPEEVRAMFIDLYDESKDIIERINDFKMNSDKLLRQYGNGALNHYQRENAISTYLWLRYPDKYYIYKFNEIRRISAEIESDYHFKKGAYADNIRNFLKLYDEICLVIKEDTELVNLFKSQLTDTCYPDPELKTLTVDVGFYISRYYQNEQSVINGYEDDELGEIDNNYFTEEWAPSLEEYTPGISKEQWLKLLNNKNIIGPVWGGVLAAFYEIGGAATCSEIAKKYNKTASGISGVCSSLAIRIHKETQCPLTTRKNGKKRYWPVLFQGKNAGPNNIGKYIWKLRPELYDALTEFDIMRYQWKTDEINTSDDPGIRVTDGVSIDNYTKNDFLDEVYMTEKRYEKLVGVLRNKKNIILQGAPGVGKTFAARRLAWSMMGEKDDSHIEFVQFHQSYSYEDFMMGYKPVEDGFAMKYGVFYRFCQKAANEPDKDFFFIIDEINRGNLSKIFGELLMLIEKDYRGKQMTLAYDELSFSVPENIFIIGMMNTADRSLAMIDYALRRRFSFFEMDPGFDSEGFIKYQNSLNNETMNKLVAKVKELNNEIILDKSLGKGFCIGHSYFCGMENCTEERLHSIVDYDILPMLGEYWFDDNDKLQRWENNLQGVFQ